MQSKLRRWMWAILLSGSCFGATLFWYHSTAVNTLSTTSEKPIAYVVKIVDEIQRRPATRLLWQGVATGDPLYNGESVRTSQLGEVRIQFRDGKEIDLEPESLMVLSAEKGQVSLDLLEGGLVVDSKSKSTEAGSDQLVLKSASGQIDISQAKAAISRGNGTNVEVQVLEGSAKIKDQNGATRTVQQGSASQIGNAIQDKKFEIISLNPKSGDRIFLDPEGDLESNFEWQALPKSARVELVMGPARKQLSKVAELNVVANSSPAANKIKAKVAFGKSFWQLNAYDPNSNVLIGQSNLLRTEWAPRFPPTAVFPLNLAEMRTTEPRAIINLQWQAGELQPQVAVELSNDPNLRKKIISKVVTGIETLATPPLPHGTYYWRLTAFYRDTKQPFIGKTLSFTVRSDDKKVAVAPLPPPPLAINWTVPEDLSQQMYIDKPVLDLSWTVENPESVDAFKLILKDAQNPSAPPIAVETKIEKNNGNPLKNAETKIPLTKPGRFIASIEAYDKDGKKLGQSATRNFESSALPLLKSPRWTNAQPEVVATLDGQAQVAWEKVDGAKEYVFSVLREGKEIQTKRMRGTDFSFRNLLPGEYQVNLTSVDNYGRISSEPSTKKIVVPDKSGLKAPSLKKIKVN